MDGRCLEGSSLEVNITVPVLAEESPEATFVAWLKAPGDPVRAGEPIAEVMTEKVNVEVESPADGVLQSQAAVPDQTLAPGAVLGTIRTG